ncbi:MULTISPECIES: nuclear transport factor 2 family protein [Sphingobium]|uniref:nuclear transport factor 2 family protein n=1 Tax=Sphingobium TaxID=165695 RepID=UPI00159C5758|nr:nuclear transport factor 2 family protein [Sphingobium sp. 15-1]
MQDVGQVNNSLSDIQAITDILHRYCRSMDRIDRPMGYSIWSDDSFADYGEIFRGSGPEFIDWACDHHSTLVSTSHQICNPIIKLMGQRAASESYVTAGLLGQADGGYVLSTARARYLDEWICQDGRWGIKRRRFMLDFVYTHGVDQLVIGPDSRNRSDPSYDLLGDIFEA